MDKIVQFLNGTRIASRVLAVLWLVFALTFNFANESKILEIFDATVLFLFPAIINELCKNPAFYGNTSRFFSFMRNTKVISRVLLQLWAFAGLLSANSIPQNFLFTFPIMAFVFLIPVAIIERKKNPVLNQSICHLDIENESGLENQDKISARPHTNIEEKPKKYISKSRIASFMLFGYTILSLILGVLANCSAETSSANNMVPALFFAIITIVVFIVSLSSPKTKEEEIRRKEHRKENYKKPLPGQIVAGTVLCIIGGFFSIGLLTPLFLVIEDAAFFAELGLEGIAVAIGMGLCGLLLLIIGIAFLQGRFVDAALERKKRNSFDVVMRPYDAVYEERDEFQSDDISSIDGMDGHDFEYFCADLLRNSGFSEVSVTKGSGDQGVDVLATKDGIKYAIQCKNYATPLGNTPVQEVHAGKTFYNCHVGVVMTNSTFTAGAKALAQATGVLLWDRTVLLRMMRE